MDISFILISHSEIDLSESVHALKTIIQNENLNAEIIISIGQNPSKQRNESAKIAHGNWLYFLDDDSKLDSHTISQFYIALKMFPSAVVFGGPSLAKPEEQNLWQEAVQIVFTSDFGIGPIKSRYLSVGQVRRSSEKELILCNMIIEKQFFLQNNGFNESLYPNEENEFLSRIFHHGQIVYSPLMIVYRNHRNSVSSFFKQMIRYGRGRTIHFLYANSYTDYIYFLPMVFVLLILLLSILMPNFHLLLLLTACYFALILPTCLVRLLFSRNIFLFILSIFAFVTCHVGYGIGLGLGFFIKKRGTVSAVETKFIGLA